eukprot:810436-Pyramimonas_sp.AAC.1
MDHQGKRRLGGRKEAQHTSHTGLWKAKRPPRGPYDPKVVPILPMQARTYCALKPQTLSASGRRCYVWFVVCLLHRRRRCPPRS